MNCKHPARHTYHYTVNEPKCDEAGDVIYVGEHPLYHTVLVGGCAECGEVLPEREMKVFQVNYNRYREESA